MGRLFGTDGIRGHAGVELTAALAMKIGEAAAEVLTESGRERPKILIGKDTRASSDMLESALAAGICAVGGDVVLLGVVPTPAVAYLTVTLGADAGIMISASHNPYGDNGIKIFSADGCKLPDEVEDIIEQRIESGVSYKFDAEIGRITTGHAALMQYVSHVRRRATDLSGLRVLVDCSNGSASVTARDIFASLNADTDFINDAPDGLNINRDCGSTHLLQLSERVVSGGYDVGVAFDGDADRCLIVNERGEVVDGDHIMLVCAEHMKRSGELLKDTVVATVMSNLGFHKYAQQCGINVITASVGDRYVLEAMRAGVYNLGGEQSGHLIFLDDATTGDGQLTAVKYLGILSKSGGKASELDAGIVQYPQLLKNVRVTPLLRATACQTDVVKQAIAEAEAMLGEGRILVRPSGTEPLVRVMAEGVEADAVERAASHIIAALDALVASEINAN